MIFYFSATGNSKHVAESLANGEKCVSITDCIKSGKYDFTLEKNENLGFVTPTYFWGTPAVTLDFMKRLNINKNGENYTYFVATYGTTTGQNAKYAENALSAKNLRFDARFSVKMPDTWTPVFDLSDKEKTALKNKSAEEEIKDVSVKISERRKGDFINKKIPEPLAKAYYKTYGCKSKTEHLSVNENCIGCGLCAKKCPVGAIEMKDKKPVWVKESCAMCLGCLHRCPKFAIRYGSKTEKHGQYVNPYTRV